MSGYKAQPCVDLREPVNGNMVCTGIHVTDQNCTMSCDPGYELIGSETRTCQPNHYWSGESVSCDPLHCPVLTAPMNAFVTQPCNTEFTSTCIVICDQGYEITNETGRITWTQSCVLNNNGSVEWTEEKSCQGTVIIISLLSFHSAWSVVYDTNNKVIMPE